MFYWFYPMNGMYAYECGTAAGRLLMDMRAAADNCYRNQNRDTPYYAVLDGESSGPYSFDEIRAMVRDGKITRESYIWKPQMTDWEFAANLTELKPLVSFTPPPVPSENAIGEKSDDTGK